MAVAMAYVIRFDHPERNAMWLSGDFPTVTWANSPMRSVTEPGRPQSAPQENFERKRS